MDDAGNKEYLVACQGNGHSVECQQHKKFQQTTDLLLLRHEVFVSPPDLGQREV